MELESDAMVLNFIKDGSSSKFIVSVQALAVQSQLNGS